MATRVRTEVELTLSREVAADLYGFIHGFEANYSHPFVQSVGTVIEQLRAQLTYEEAETGNERYGVWAEDPK